MPKVGSTHYPYTKKGKRDAKLARQRQATKLSGGGKVKKSPPKRRTK
jgi:hypothetical protein